MKDTLKKKNDAPEKKKRGRPPKKIDSAAQEIIDSTDALVDETHEEINAPVDWATTGVDVFDCALGGGFGWGKVVNIVGDNSSGKTLLAAEFIARQRKVYGKKLRWFYDDAENGFSFDSERMFNFKLIQDGQHMSATIDDFSYNLSKQLRALKKGERLVYVLDSLDSLSSKEEKERDVERFKAMDAGKDFDKGTYGMEKQKKLSELFRQRTSEIAENKQCILIVVSQVRANINAMFAGDKFVRSGGKALDFYAAQIIWLSEVEKHRRKDRVVGVTIKARVKKNKLGKPFRECFMDILFDYGADNVTSGVKFVYDLLTPQGREKEKANKLKWGKLENDFTLRGLVEYIEDKNKEDELTSMVKKRWNEIEEEVATKRKARW